MPDIVYLIKTEPPVAHGFFYARQRGFTFIKPVQVLYRSDPDDATRVALCVFPEGPGNASYGLHWFDWFGPVPEFREAFSQTQQPSE